MNGEFDALIVGGGPAGSATAWFLARAGARVVVLDRARFPRDKPCAEYLSPQASRILAAMGVEEEIERAGAVRLHGMIVRAPCGSTVRGDFVGSHGYRGFRDSGLAVRRSTLDKLLLDKAREAGAEVREGWRVLDLVNDGGLRVRGVSGSHGDGKRFSERATVVVGADGLNSIVASRARLTQRARWPRRVALVAHYENISGLTDWGEMHVDRGGYLGVARVGGDVANVALVIQARGARRIGGDLSGFLDAWIARRPHLAERFLSARRLAAVRATGPFARSTSRPWSDGLALAGDAAGFFDPFTGEGIYTALRGGEMLAEHLLRMYAGSNGNTALSDYESARRREFASRQLVEKIVGLAVGWPSFINRAAQQLSRRKEMADLLVGVTGDFVPAREVLTPRYLLGLLI